MEEVLQTTSRNKQLLVMLIHNYGIVKKQLWYC